MKRWTKSKTLWFNAICAALAALEGLTGAMQPYLSVNAFALLSIALPVGNAVLRVVTSEPLGK
jgi:hypothetical protein